MKKQTRKRYTPEYKVEAIALTKVLVLVKPQHTWISITICCADGSRSKEREAQPFSNHQGKAGMTTEQKRIRELEQLYPK